MTRLHKIALISLGVLVLGLLYLAHAYSVRQAKAEAEQTAAEKVIAAKDQALKDRDSLFAQWKADKDLELANLKTAKQAIQVLMPTIAAQGGTAPATVAKGDLPPEIAKTLPGPSTANFTLLGDDQMVKLGQRELNCQISEAGLTKCDQDKTDLQAKIDALTKANIQWEKAGKVGPWIAGLGAARNADGKGYTPTMLFGRRINKNLGGMIGVQGRGDLSFWATWNFGGPK